MTRYMLDTNIVSHLLKAHPGVAQRVRAVPMSALCISAISHGELMYGLAKRPLALRLREAVDELLRRVEILPWDRDIAPRYGEMRASLNAQGKVLAPLDQLIAAHALAAGTVLVTNDTAFALVPHLQVEDWVNQII